MKTLFYSALLVLCLAIGCSSVSNRKLPYDLAKYNVVWDSPGKNAYDSMPAGNGDTGINLWTEENGDLLFYIGKTDAWSENGRLLKLGRVRLSFTPNPFTAGMRYRQELNLPNGEIIIHAGEQEKELQIRVWVDADNPVIRLQVSGKQPVTVQANVEMWRTERRELTGDEVHSAYGLHNGPEPVFVEKDHLYGGSDDMVIWYHRNECSVWKDNMALQGLGHLTDTQEDPLLNRTFGGALQISDETGKSCAKKQDDGVSLASGKGTSFLISVYTYTAQTQTLSSWIDLLKNTITEVQRANLRDQYRAHTDWWHDFWKRSWIIASGTEEAETVTRGYILQRWINASAGRGAYPIKFNGSLFTVDTYEKGYDADYRMWGGCYWFQNTRLPYWSMLALGDFDMMKPLFTMYMNALETAKERTKIYYGHSGAFYPETMYFWGTYNFTNYGWNRKGMPAGLTENQYIRYYWQGGLELATMMLDYYEYTRDKAFLHSTLLPFASEILLFFDQHWPRDENGKIRMEPSMSLETWWECINPLPEIAGQRYLIGRLLKLPDTVIPESLKTRWQKTLTDLPEIPISEENGEKYILPAEKFDRKQNQETPEMYAVFPYRLYGVGKPDIETARETFSRRLHKTSGGWKQDAVMAAYLGLTEEAKRFVVFNFSHKHEKSRFPAFWGPNFDWVPDQDHGSVAVLALQKMLLQEDEHFACIAPAWPKDWDVDFKLNMYNNNTITGKIIGGKTVDLDVSPDGTPVKVLDMKNPSWPGTVSEYVSFPMYSFTIDDMECKIVVPDKPAEGKPWIWRARFLGHWPATEKALLERGYHVAYVDVAGLYGSPKAVARWDKFYKFLVEQHGFDKKTVLEGLSRGGLIIYNWAIKNPEKVHCLYGDAPVCDFKSWPGIKEPILENYGLTKEEALAYMGNPVDNLKPLADAGVRILHVVGDADKTVPVTENTAIVEKRYKELGGYIKVIHKPGVGHHPHSLEDVTPIVNFILKHSGRE